MSAQGRRRVNTSNFSLGGVHARNGVVAPLCGPDDVLAVQVMKRMSVYRQDHGNISCTLEFEGWDNCDLVHSTGNPARLPSPPVAQFPQPGEHGPGIRLVRQVGKIFAQPGNDAGTAQAQEGVDSFFVLECDDSRFRRIVLGDGRQKSFCGGVVGLAVQSEPEIVLDVVMAGIDLGVVRQPGQLLHEGGI